jgi:putative transposase
MSRFYLKWIQKYKPKKFNEKKKINEFIIDETAVKVGSELIWFWVVIEPMDKEIFAIDISKELNMVVAERFLSNVIKEYGEHSVLTDGGTRYPQAYKFLKLEYHIHYTYGKSIIERTMQYLKDRIENFDDYFPCKKNKCKLKHVKQWLNLFIDQYNER